MGRARWCVIFNPTAGRRRARHRLERLRSAWADWAEFRPTAAPRDAIRMARDAATEGFEAVVAAGGDGTAHEVANGILESDRHDVVCGVAPLGSANDYVHSLNQEFGSSPLDDARVHAVDVGRARIAGGPECFFINSLGLGLAGAVTVESRAIDWLQGVPLYGLATLRALCRRFAAPPLTLRFDAEPERVERTLMLSLMIGRREGNFVLAPEARLADGQFDYAQALNLSRWNVLCLLPRLAWSGPPREHRAIRTGRCRRLHVVSPEPITAHTDGEIFCRPEDGARELDMELLPARLSVRVLGAESTP